ncbi:MAG: hypothetical protein MN733_13365 [Nitrososphaera sp.]|nr:hypothetical protein [Nitrososphaera sp.]
MADTKHIRLKGWRTGDAFMVRENLGRDNDYDDGITGVTQKMTEMKGQILHVLFITDKLGEPWLIDDEANFAWRPEWVNKIT